MRRRWLWLIGGGAAALLVLGLANAYLSTRYVNVYRGWVEARLGAELGVSVAIIGDLEMSVGWTPGIVVRNVTLSGLGADQPALARVERLEARIALMPFVTSFGRELIVERVAAEGTQLWLGRPPAKNAKEVPRGEIVNPLPEAARMSMRLRALEAKQTTLHIAAGRDMLEIEIATASAVAAGDALRIAATGSFAGRAIRVEGTTDAIERWPLPPQRAHAVDLMTSLDDAAQIRIHGSVTGGGIDVAVRVDVRELANAPAISATQPLGVSMRVRAAALRDDWRLTDVAVTLGTLALTGEGALRLAEIPDLKLTLQTALLDLTLLGHGGATPASAGSPAVAALDRFTAEIALTATAATLPQNVRLSDLRSQLVVRDGKVELKELTAALASGTITATGELTALGAYTTNLTARGVDLGHLIRETRGKSVVTGGATTLRADLHGTLASGKGVMASVAGRADVSVGRASVSNSYSDRFGFLQIFNLIDRALPLGPSIAVNCAAGRFTIQDGIARTRGLMIDLPRLALWVGGRIDLDSEAINLRVEPQVKVASLVSVVPPANVRGTIGNPIIEPDVIGTAVGVASGLLSAPELLVGEVGDVLSSLVGGASGRSARAPSRCQPAGRPAQESRPGLLPNLFDLFR